MPAVSGFTNAPVSRALVYGLVASSVLVALAEGRDRFDFHAGVVLASRQWWRLLSWQVGAGFCR